MYKALKEAQTNLNEILLKLVDDIASVSENRSVPLREAAPLKEAVPLIEAVPLREPAPLIEAVPLREAAPLMEAVPANTAKQTDYETLLIQFQALNEEIHSLRKEMNTIISFMVSNGQINTEVTIPILQPGSSESEMKNVITEEDACGVSPIRIPPTPVQSSPPTPSTVAHYSDVEPEPEPEPESEAEAEVEAEAEEEIEVEEWTYKGRVYFKDSENTVYANTNGELGDPIGLYDPMKNIVKKLPTSS